MTGRVIEGGTRTVEISVRAPLTPPAVAPGRAHRTADRLRGRAGAVTVVALGLAVLADAVLVWQRRWISDDGLIFLRTVRQILDGHGPVFNVGERVETNTSTLWTLALLALAALPVRLELASVGAGLVLSVGALALALDAARRFTGRGRIVVPAGGLVVLGMPPFWDFGTSGLETGLTFAWLALAWWLLVRRSQRPAVDAPPGHGPDDPPQAGPRRRPGRAWPVALVLGLGPLVRPDLALVAGAALLALLVLEEPREPRGWVRATGLGAVAAALPLGYEVFRAGYYGLLVPATALAKEAGEPRWGRGVVYLRDTLGVYWLAVPALALAGAAAALLRPRLRRADRLRALLADPGRRRRRTWDRAGTVAVALVPLVGGLGMLLYVVRVGGDFMHARMLLPAIFCLLLPVMALPLRRATVVALATVLVWALVSGSSLRPHGIGIGVDGIADEREFYTALLGTQHPLTADAYRMHPYVLGGIRMIDASPVPVLAVQARGRGPSGPEWELVPLAPGRPSGMVWLNLGVASALAPLDVRVTDTVGLADPVAAHTGTVPDGRVGHDKNLPFAWVVAESGGVPPDQRAVRREDVAAAARALQCPVLRELDASVHAPMTPARFWANLVGAPQRTALRFPRDPVLAEVACTVRKESSWTR